MASNVVPFATNSLYVGDLHPDVTEGMLYEKFSSVGQVISLRLCRDFHTNRSLCYGYVNFSLLGDAERVLDTMNFDLIHGKPMRLMWCQRDPGLRRSGIGNVFIKNLDKDIDNKALYDTFSAFGNILSCKIALDEKGMSKGYGFVHFDRVESATLAIEKTNGMLLNNKKVFVGRFVPKSEREISLGERGNKFTNVYVKNFGNNMSDERFRRLFARFGNITSCQVMKRSDGSSKGFGFVAFDIAKAAEMAVKELDGTELDGQILYLGRAQKKAERQMELRKRFEEFKSEHFDRVQGSNIYIKNLDDTIDTEKLLAKFSEFGKITSGIVMNENGRSKGFGFVCYTLPEDARKAISKMHGIVWGSKPLFVCLAQRKEERKAYLNNQFMQRVRLQNVGFQGHLPLFFPAAPGHRMYNSLMSPNNLIRNDTRWPRTPFVTCHRLSLRPPVNTMRPRPIVGGPLPGPRQNNKYNPNSARPMLLAGPGNGGDPQDQKQIIGEKLYEMVSKICPGLAGKITGMLLEIEYGELVHLIDNKKSLKDKVDEAMAVLQAHKTKTGLVGVHN